MSGVVIQLVMLIWVAGALGMMVFCSVVSGGCSKFIQGKVLPVWVIGGAGVYFVSMAALEVFVILRGVS